MWKFITSILKFLAELVTPPPPEEHTMANALQIDMLSSGIVDANGVPLAGGKVYTYEAGSTDTDKPTYTDAPMTTEATNPIVLNTAGVANVYGYGNYKFAIYTSADVLVRTLDNQYYIVPSSTTDTVTTVTADTSPTAVNQTIKCNTAGGNITVNLPTAVGNEGCRIVVLKTSASNTVTIEGYSSETINGAANVSMTAVYEVIEVISDNTNWVIVNSNTGGGSLAVTTTGTQTLTNKTLTTPVIASFYQDAGKTKLMTTPNTASDTLCAIAATQTLTNKTLTSPALTTPSLTSPSIVTGASMAGTYIIKSADNSGWYIAGGNAYNVGGHILLTGSTHATNPSEIQLHGTIVHYNTAGDAYRGISVEAWNAFTLKAGWAASTTCSYMKDPMGFVHLRGIAVQSGGSYSMTIWETTALPAGYRPEQNLTFVGHVKSGAMTTFSIYTDGHAVVGDTPDASAPVYLDGITFKAA